MQIHLHIHAEYNDTMKTKTQFLEKYTSHFIWKVCVWEGVGDRTELQHIDPHSYGHQRCVFPVLQGCSWGPGASHSGCWLPLPHLVSNSSDLQLTDFLLSPSYIIVQSPTQYLPITGHLDESLPVSLEWHIWLSSSENNSHAVLRSLSSGASVWLYHGILPCPILSAKPAYTISSHNFHRNVSLPSAASLWNGMFGRVEGQYTTIWLIAWSKNNWLSMMRLREWCSRKKKCKRTEKWEWSLLVRYRRDYHNW